MPKPDDFTACPNWGQGGRYIYDPDTGERTPVVDEEAALTPPADVAATDTQATKKGK